MTKPVCGPVPVNQNSGLALCFLPRGHDGDHETCDMVLLPRVRCGSVSISGMSACDLPRGHDGGCSFPERVQSASPVGKATPEPDPVAAERDRVMALCRHFAEVFAVGGDFKTAKTIELIADHVRCGTVISTERDKEEE